MRHETAGRRACTTAIVLLIPALFVPGAGEAQSGSADRGGGSSFGRISGGGGSYGHLTHGFTARRPSARIPINALTRANGTANEPRRGRTERVPINAQTRANGTANSWREPPGDAGPGKRPIHGPLRGPFLIDGRPYYQYVAASRVMPPYAPVPAEDPTERRRRLGGVPALEAELAEAGAGEPGDAREMGTGQRMAPRVKPPVPPDPATADEALPAEECAVVRVTTVGGIEWRQRIRLTDYDASTPEESAAHLQEALDRSEPLSISGPDGSFTVRPGLVRSLIVGPCREF